MKLYIEEQVKETLKLMGLDLMINEFLKKAEPIELPSDEEIKTESHNHYLKGQLYIEPASDTEYAFKKGALWMKEQILNQNNKVSTQDPAIDIITNPEEANNKETDIKKADINFMYKWIREKSGK